MKLSDFGLCKPLDCTNLSDINENEVLDDENLHDTVDVDESFPGKKVGDAGRAPSNNFSIGRLTEGNWYKKNSPHVLDCEIP